ncbi:MAG TPA: ABC transporter ATP-binding protein [Xanthobacteraceae bacterium]|jgi:subfamily B ATP-binding cassette protein MsbA|nr:ABC transporter ATP-binding protein [Xanthobacteraceae bacterium]
MKADTASSTDDYSTYSLVRRLLVDEALVHWPRYTLAFALMAISAAATALTAYLLGSMTNEAYVNHNYHGIVVIGVIAMVIFAAKGFATYGSTVTLSWIGNSIIADNQRRLFDKLLAENIGFFADRHSSEFIARLTTGANAVSGVINLLITAIGRDLMSLIGLCVVMVIQDPAMSLFGFIGAPPAFYFLRKVIRRVRGIARMQFNGGTRIIETMQESLQGMRMVKAFGLEDEMRRRLNDSVTAVQHESNKMARVANRASPIMEMLGGFTVALASIYGGYRVVETGATPGEFVSFMAAFLLAYEPAKRLARLNIDLNNNLVGVRVLYEIIDSPPGEPNDDDLPALKLTESRVEFDHVNFAYRADAPVLQNMNLVAQPGQVTALVGPSGGGKSTVLNLMLRFYNVGSGRVLIDGQNIAAVSRNSLRHQIGYVGQIVHLFRGSVRENIALGKLDASEAEIVAAAKAAHAHDFIMGFPQGYDTQVGEHGMQLSGGQRQRISIARALIKNAPIILLDEATASLDSESERYVQEAIAELCKGRTTLVIAHRLSTIRDADTILVVENGQVVESGRHDELLRKSGRYASFYRLQLKEQSSAAPELIVAPVPVPEIAQSA